MYETVEVKHVLPWRPQEVGNGRIMGYLLRKPTDWCRTSPRERRVLQLTKLKGAGDLRSALTSDLEVQSLESAPVVVSRALIQ